MSWERVMVTGHRPQKMTHLQAAYAQKELRRLALKLRDENGMKSAISGMALGTDTWWAEYALWAKVELWAFIPFPQQPDRWSDHDQRAWAWLRSQATEELVISDHYSVENLLERNSAMVAVADAAIAVWSQAAGKSGTSDAVAKIRQAGKPLIIVDLDRFVTVMDPTRKETA